MIRLTEKIHRADRVDATLTLPLEDRCRSRLRVSLDDGRDAGLFLRRGSHLKDGELLRSSCGVTVRVKAAPESLSSVRCEDPQLLARACYHLGNRHVPLQIEAPVIRYLRDPVLDRMLSGLGLEVQAVVSPFEPEPGAYGAHTHGHPHED